MKTAVISIILLAFTIGIVILMDILQGFSMFHTMNTFIEIKQQMIKEDYVLVFIFFLPLFISKIGKLKQK